MDRWTNEWMDGWMSEQLTGLVLQQGSHVLYQSSN